MADTGLYKVQSKTDAGLLLYPGYTEAFISLKTDFTTLSEPTPGMTPVAGDNYIISDDHVWTSGKEPIPVLINKDTLEVAGESSGEVYTQRLIFRPQILMLGDSPASLEMALNWLNEDCIIFVKDGCPGGQILQFGCDCYPAIMEKQGFGSGTTLAGQKGYTFTFRSLCKYFYTGTFTARAAG